MSLQGVLNLVLAAVWSAVVMEYQVRRSPKMERIILFFLTEAHCLVSVTKAVEVELAGVLLAKGLDRDLQTHLVYYIAELPLRHRQLILHLLFEDGLLVVLVAMVWLVTAGFFGYLRSRSAMPAMRGISCIVTSNPTLLPRSQNYHSTIVALFFTYFRGWSSCCPCCDVVVGCSGLPRVLAVEVGNACNAWHFLDRDLQSHLVDKIKELPLCHRRLVLHLLFEDGLLVVLVAMSGMIAAGFSRHLRSRSATPAMHCIFS